MKRILLALVFTALAGSANAGGEMISLDHVPVQAPSDMSDAVVLRSDQGQFVVAHDGELLPVNHYDVEPFLRDMTLDQYVAFLESGQVQISKCNDGSLILRSHIGLKGGGGKWRKLKKYAIKGTIGGACAGAAVLFPGTWVAAGAVMLGRSAGTSMLFDFVGDVFGEPAEGYPNIDLVQMSTLNLWPQRRIEEQQKRLVEEVSQIFIKDILPGAAAAGIQAGTGRITQLTVADLNKANPDTKYLMTLLRKAQETGDRGWIMSHPILEEAARTGRPLADVMRDFLG